MRVLGSLLFYKFNPLQYETKFLGYLLRNGPRTVLSNFLVRGYLRRTG